MIYVTGDTHGDIDRFKDKEIASLKKGDTLIICGDFGFLWDDSKAEKRKIKWLSKRKYNIVFVEGCNENYNLLEKLEVEEWNGGKVHSVAPNIKHLLRGEVFEIESKTFFAFGGGDNSELLSLTENQANDGKEIPTLEQVKNADENLTRVEYTIDYIITHETPSSIKQFMFMDGTNIDFPHIFLEQINSTCKFKTWFFGKYHMDKKLTNAFHSVFKRVVKIL